MNKTESAPDHHLSVGPDESYSDGGPFFVRLYYKDKQVGLITEAGGGVPITGAAEEAAIELRRLLPSRE